MNTAKTNNRTNQKQNLGTAAAASAQTDISRAALVTVGGFSAVAGLWAVACFVGGMVVAGGPIGLVRSWFAAVLTM